MKPRTKKLLRILLGLALLLCPLFVGGTHFLNRARFEMDLFEEAAATLVDRSRELGEMATVFDQARTLENLPPSAINGFTYRFDDHLNDATPMIDTNDQWSAGEGKTERTIDFAQFDAQELRLHPPDARIRDDVLRIEPEADDSQLRSVEGLDIPVREVEKIEVRMKSTGGATFQLLLSDSTGESAAEIPARKFLTATLHVLPDGKFHTYVYDAKATLAPWKKAGKTIRGVTFRPRGNPDDRIEIESIRFLSPLSKIAGSPRGVIYESIQRNLRKAIYSQVPQAIGYSLKLPTEDLKLRFGIGAIHAADPLDFLVRLGDGETTETIFAKTAAEGDPWQDAEIDLSHWKGRRVTISFEVEGQPGAIALWSNPAVFGAPSKRMNVVFVLEDALRADHLSAYGYERDTSPVKDALIEKHGVLFERAFSQATWTRSSCPSIMTGLYPTATGVFDPTHRLHDRYLTLAEILRSQGFATAIFEENLNAGKDNGLHQGFGSYWHMPKTQTIRSLPGKEMLWNWIEAQGERNFFLYLHLLDPHFPYSPDKHHRAWYEGLTLGENSSFKDGKRVDHAELEALKSARRRALYDGEIKQNDEFFEQLLNKMKDLGAYENTLFVVLSDHGEYFGEHGIWKHFPPGYRQGIHTPLAFISPSIISEGVRVSTPVQNADIFPSVLDYCGIDREKLLIQGESIFPPAVANPDVPPKRRIVYSEEAFDGRGVDDPLGASVFFGRWHAINSRRFGADATKDSFGPRAAWKLRVFDTGRDVEETRYLNTFFVDLFFKRRMERFFRDLQEANHTIWESLGQDIDEDAAFDTESLAQMRKLGYID